MLTASTTAALTASTTYGANDNPDVVRRVRDRLSSRPERIWERLGDHSNGETPAEDVPAAAAATLQVSATACCKVRSNGNVDSEVLEAVLDSFDVEESMLTIAGERADEIETPTTGPYAGGPHRALRAPQGRPDGGRARRRRQLPGLRARGHLGRCTCGSASAAATSAAATPPSAGTRTSTSTPPGTGSCAASSPTRTGAGATSTNDSDERSRAQAGPEKETLTPDSRIVVGAVGSQRFLRLTVWRGDPAPTRV